MGVGLEPSFDFTARTTSSAAAIAELEMWLHSTPVCHTIDILLVL